MLSELVLNQTSPIGIKKTKRKTVKLSELKSPGRTLIPALREDTGLND